MPTLDPRLAGFTKTGKPSLATIAVHDAAPVALPVALQNHFVVAERQPARGEDQLHRRLVHADGRGEHAGADVGDVRELEQALHGAVLAVRPVQHRKHDIEREARDDGPLRQVPIDGDERIPAGTRDHVRFECGSLRVRCLAPRSTSAAERSVGGRSGSVHRPSFSMRIGIAS